MQNEVRGDICIIKNAQHKQKEKDDVEYKVVRRQKSEIPEDSKMENY